MTSRTLKLTATSIADDLGFVALYDVSSVMAVLERPYRIIGGHMVTALAPDSFEPSETLKFCRRVVATLFADRDGAAMTRLAAAQKLSTEGADARHTRIRALADRVLG